MIVRLKRLALMTVMAVLAMNIWTGGPLFALWLGSRVQGSGPPSMSGSSKAASSGARSN